MTLYTLLYHTSIVYIVVSHFLYTLLCAYLIECLHFLLADPLCLLQLVPHTAQLSHQTVHQGLGWLQVMLLQSLPRGMLSIPEPGDQGLLVGQLSVEGLVLLPGLMVEGAQRIVTLQLGGQAPVLPVQFVHRLLQQLKPGHQGVCTAITDRGHAQSHGPHGEEEPLYNPQQYKGVLQVHFRGETMLQKF